jgi:hypothetical protein
MASLITTLYLFTGFIFGVQFHAHGAQLLVDTPFFPLACIEEAQDAAFKFGRLCPSERQPQVAITVVPDKGRA